MSLFWFVLLPIILALFGYIIQKKHALLLIIIFQGLLVLMAVFLFTTVKHRGLIADPLGDYPISIGITLYSDRLSAVLVLLTTFLFLCMLIFNYHKPYMSKLFLFSFLILQGLLNGLFLARDFFNIYALIEVSTVVVSILIMFKKDNRSIYDGMVYLLTNMVAMAFYLLGIGYIYKIFGTLDFRAIETSLSYVKDPSELFLPYALIMTAVGLKAAIMPLFSWLPRAHGTPSAPSIVSAILSGLYVKSGIYLFIRFKDLFHPIIDTNDMFLLIGFATAIIGFIFAISQTDIKLILAYSTVSQIGLIIFSLSLGTPGSYWGGLYHLLNHAIFKSALFLTAGILIENYGTRNITEIKGVIKSHPFVSVIIILSIFGITGAPLFNGSISKYMIQTGTSQRSWLDYGLLLINWGTILIFMKYMQIFFGQSPLKLPLAHLVRWNQKIILSVLSISCLIGGIAGKWLIQFLFGLQTYISVVNYTEKALIYFLSVISAYFFYRYLFGKIRFFQTIREIELDMNQIVLSFVIFFFGLLSYLHIA